MQCNRPIFQLPGVRRQGVLVPTGATQKLVLGALVLGLVLGATGSSRKLSTGSSAVANKRNILGSEAYKKNE